MRGDVNTYNDVANQMSAPTALTSAAQVPLTVTGTANWRFNGSQTFTVALLASMAA